MNRKIQILLGEAKGKMNGYAGLLQLRFGNLCVKSDITALLPVTVVIDGEELNIEEVADVGKQDDNVLAVIPKDRDDLYDIGKGIMKAHPEFKMDTVQNKNSSDEDDKYLIFTMPDMDDERHKKLHSGVNGLHDQCQLRIDAVHDVYAARIFKELKDADSKAIDSAKDKLEEIYSFYNNMIDTLSNDKLKEIEDAYQSYKTKEQQKEQDLREQEQAHGTNKGQSMTFDQ